MSETPLVVGADTVQLAVVRDAVGAG